MSGPRQSTEYFSKWYELHKEDLSVKRKQRYATDPEYRRKALENRANQLQKQRGLSPLNPVYTTTFSTAAKELEITIWRLRNWRRNSYFPEPYQYGKFLYFTKRQLQLIAGLRDAIGEKHRLSKDEKEKLENTVNFIFANWDE